CLIALTLTADASQGQEDVGEDFSLTPEQLERSQRFSAIEWSSGPTTGAIGNMAEIDVPEGYSFTGASGAQELLVLYGNPRSTSILGALVPQSESEDWTLIFQFEDIGYVDDSDRDALDAEALMESFRAGIPEGNRQRREIGAEEMNSMSWQEKPFYDSTSNNLTWALNLDFPSGNSINYDIRVLGRRGVMEVTLLGSPETYAEAVPKVKDLLATFRFTQGNTYGEWRQGDKIAAVGLAGLVAGGAAVAASKTGLLAKLGVLLAKGGKAIVVAVVAIFAGLGSVFKRFFGGGNDDQ
ncbi:MAG: DUF2167 domain-containing protein, partial [Planctomycetota bacterium]